MVLTFSVGDGKGRGLDMVVYNWKLNLRVNDMTSWEGRWEKEKRRVRSYRDREGGN